MMYILLNVKILMRSILEQQVYLHADSIIYLTSSEAIFLFLWVRQMAYSRTFLKAWIPKTETEVFLPESVQELLFRGATTSIY